MKISKLVAVYDNDGRTFDRYSVIYLTSKRGWLYECTAMSANPYAPQGFCQHTEVASSGWSLGDQPLFSHLGRRVSITRLPEEVQAVIQDELRLDGWHWNRETGSCRNSIKVEIAGVAYPVINPWAQVGGHYLWVVGYGDEAEYAMWLDDEIGEEATADLLYDLTLMRGMRVTVNWRYV